MRRGALQADRERGAGCFRDEASGVCPRPAAEVVGTHRWLLDGLGEQLLRGGSEDLGDKSESGCLHVGVAEGIATLGPSSSVVGKIPPVPGWGAMVFHGMLLLVGEPPGGHAPTSGAAH